MPVGLDSKKQKERETMANEQDMTSEPRRAVPHGCPRCQDLFINEAGPFPCEGSGGQGRSATHILPWTLLPSLEPPAT